MFVLLHSIIRKKNVWKFICWAIDCCNSLALCSRNTAKCKIHSLALLSTTEVINIIDGSTSSIVRSLLSRKICFPIHNILKNTGQIACKTSLPFFRLRDNYNNICALKFSFLNISQCADRKNLKRLIILYSHHIHVDIFDMAGWYLFDKGWKRRARAIIHRRCRDIFIGNIRLTT